jgi:hypothetical protein
MFVAAAAYPESTLRFVVMIDEDVGGTYAV